MLSLLLFIYIFVALFLIICILFDKGKGSEIGALSTGNEFLSPKSSSSFFNKIIIFFIILFLIINFSITFISKNTSINSKPIVDLLYNNNNK
ncbi:MAG TPA: preprotein translocase subunit SecG [Candidatus Azoamicus sp. MARI]